MSFAADILTLYPQMFPASLGMSIAGRALERGDWSLQTHHIRDFAIDKHKTVDDSPAGGGPGMVLKPDVLGRAIDSLAVDGVVDDRPRLLMSPRGKPLDQAMVHEFAAGSGVVIVCGRFEGVDERVIKARNLQEVSIGDYVLSGGEPAAIILLDAIVRLLPGVMGSDLSELDESFENGLLEHPQYTKPREWEGLEIPPILLSGNHGAVEKWRHEQAIQVTKTKRPDLFEKYKN